MSSADLISGSDWRDVIVELDRRDVAAMFDGVMGDTGRRGVAVGDDGDCSLSSCADDDQNALDGCDCSDDDVNVFVLHESVTLMLLNERVESRCLPVVLSVVATHEHDDGATERERPLRRTLLWIRRIIFNFNMPWSESEV